MTRIVLIVAAFSAAIGIAVALWLISKSAEAPKPALGGVIAPQQFDMTGGQQMRPRWNQTEGQGDDPTIE